MGYSLFTFHYSLFTLSGGCEHQLACFRLLQLEGLLSKLTAAPKIAASSDAGDALVQQNSDYDTAVFSLSLFGVIGYDRTRRTISFKGDVLRRNSHRDQVISNRFGSTQ